MNLTRLLWISWADLKTSDYLFTINADQFNADIKLKAQGRYIESSAYTCKQENQKSKGRYASADAYRQKQSEIAASAFSQDSVTTGLIVHLLEYLQPDILL